MLIDSRQYQNWTRNLHRSNTPIVPLHYQSSHCTTRPPKIISKISKKKKNFKKWITKLCRKSANKCDLITGWSETKIYVCDGKVVNILESNKRYMLIKYSFPSLSYSSWLRVGFSSCCFSYCDVEVGFGEPCVSKSIFNRWDLQTNCCPSGTSRNLPSFQCYRDNSTIFSVFATT